MVEILLIIVGIVFIGSISGWLKKATKSIEDMKK